MKKILSVISGLALSVSAMGQVVVQIGTGTLSTSGVNYMPIYRSSASSAFKFSRTYFLYTAAELASAGVPAGATITKVEWDKSNTGATVASTANIVFNIFMNNSLSTGYTTTQTWSTLTSPATQVYANNNQIIPATTGFLPFTLTTPFVYNGNALEISTDWDISAVSGNPTTAAFTFSYSPITGRVGGTSNSIALNGSASMTTQSNRPNIRITYTPPPACAGTPSAGAAVASNTSICTTQTVSLFLNGSTAASGLTYQWQSSPNGSLWTSIPTGTTIAITGTVSSTTYYQCLVSCGANTSISSPVTINYGTTPNAGSTIGSASLVCPNSNVSLSISGSTTTPGLTYQWYSSPNGISYSQITSATLATATQSVPANLYFQNVLTCGTSTAASAPVQVNVAPTTTNNVPYSEGFEGITSNNQLPNCSWAASNLPTICKTYTAATGSYNQAANTGSKFASFRWGTNAAGDYFYSNGLQLTAGVTYSASVAYIADGASGWTEFSLLYGTSQSTTGLVSIASVTGNITNTTYTTLANTFVVPSTGIYYIAVKAVGNSVPWYLTWDDLSVIQPSGCFGTPASNTVVASSTSICPGTSANLSLASSYTVGGLTYQWSAATSSVGPYNAIPGATLSAYTATNVVSTTWYQAVITCTNGNVSTTATPVQITTGGSPCQCLAYCTSSATSTADDEIFNVSIGTLNNSSTCSQTGGPGSVQNEYSNYAGILAAPNLSVGTTYTLNVTVGECNGTSYSGGVVAYMDFNQNGVFTDPGELVYSSSSTLFAVTGTTLTANVTVPLTASVGTTRMRVIAVEGITGQASCGSYSWGETEDYCINLVPLAPCTSANGGTLAGTSMNACANQTLALSSNSVSTGSGTNYQWMVSNIPGGPYSNVAGGTGSTTPSYTTLSLPAATYYYVLQTTCSSASATAVSNEATVTIYAYPTASISSNAPICSGQNLNLSGGTDIGTSFMWTGPASYTSNSQNPVITNAPANANGMYTFIAAANGCTSTPATMSINVNATPSAITVSPVSASFCGTANQTITATGGLVPAVLSVGSNSNTNSSTTYPAPYTVWYGGQRMQVLILASELSSAGFITNSPINDIQFPVVSMGSNWGNTMTGCQSFQVNIGATTLTALSAFQPGLTNVVPVANYSPSVGYNNTHSFSSPFIWDGISNVILETSFSNNVVGGSNDAVIQYTTATPFNSTIIYRADNMTPSAIATSTTVSLTYAARPDLKLNGLSMGTYSWSPGSNLSSSTGSIVVATPTTSTLYTVNVANGACSSSAGVSISVTPQPTVTVSAGSGTVCSGGSTGLTASGAATYSWNTGATSAVIAVTPTSSTTYTVVGNNSPGCSGTGTVSIMVNALPSVSLSAAQTTVCVNGPTVSLTGSPAGGAYTGSNVSTGAFTPGPVSGTFIPGYAYTSTVTGCSNSASVTIVVSACTGVNKTSQALTGLQVYPNPHTGMFTIELNNGANKSIEVSDLTGRIILTGNSSSDKMNVNISDFANGVYFVKVQSNNEVEIIKVIKQ